MFRRASIMHTLPFTEGGMAAGAGDPICPLTRGETSVRKRKSAYDREHSYHGNAETRLKFR